MNEMPLPNFLVVGAAKAGTTTLWAWLRQHPEIFMSPKKETHFLIYRGKQPKADDVGPAPVRSADEYTKLFSGVANEKAIGEVSPGYLCDPDIPAEIDRYLPGAKVIAILRDPVDRAWSAFTKAVVLGHERDESEFITALKSEPMDNPDPWDGSRRYVRQGLYGEQLERYFKTLGRDRVLVLFYEDLKADPSLLLRTLFEFLDVEPGFSVDTSESMNITVKPRSHGLHDLLTSRSSIRTWIEKTMPSPLLNQLRRPVRALRLRNLKEVPRLDPETREKAKVFFLDDIQRLEKVLNKDLGHWSFR